MYARIRIFNHNTNNITNFINLHKVPIQMKEKSL